MMKQPQTVIRPISDFYFDAFMQMVGVYFPDDCDISLTNEQLAELCKEMTQGTKDGVTCLDILFAESAPIGFIQYQVDSPKSDWCEKEGFGCIRELYIHKNRRKQGYGRILAAHAESELKKMSVSQIYLTSDDVIDFWLSIGYTDTGEICDKNNCTILIKQA